MDVVIHNDEDLSAALDRIEELTGAPEGSPEESELVHICLAVEVWHTKHRLG